MWLDYSLRCSDGQAITATAPSTNAVDLGSARDIGTGKEIWALVDIATAMAAAGAATLECQLVEADDAGLTTNVVVLATSGPIAKATLVQNYKALRTRVPPQALASAKRYIGFNFVVTTGPMTAGAVNAYFAEEIEQFNAYPSSLNVNGA